MMRNQSPMFTIILPTYNRAYLCARAVKSVVDQTEQSWELKVIDDGSCDLTHQLVNSFRDARINYEWQQKAGAGAARNRGIRKARGKFICFLDSDDEFLPNHLETLKRGIQLNDEREGFYFTLGYIEYRGERKLSPDYRSTSKIPILFGETPDINGISISARILSDLKFNEDLECHEDVELWSRIALRYPVFKIRERTYVTHFHDGARITADSLRHYMAMENTYNLIESTCQNRAAIPKWALRRKLKEAYLGIVRNGWKCDSAVYWKYYWKTLYVGGLGNAFRRDVNKSILKHLLYRGKLYAPRVTG